MVPYEKDISHKGDKYNEESSCKGEDSSNKGDNIEPLHSEHGSDKEDSSHKGDYIDPLNSKHGSGDKSLLTNHVNKILTPYKENYIAWFNAFLTSYKAETH